jgi:UDP:flavonoid glycosyltransferase YjiC (YdhE family)
MATILLCPFSHGVGFGYVGRLIVFAERLRAAGHTCIFSSDAREGLVARSGFEVRASPTRHGTAVPDMGERQGDYIAIDNIDSAFGIARYYHASRVRRDVEEDLKIMEAVRPHLVLVDMQPTAAIAARYAGIPYISIGDSDTVRDDANSWMPWLSEKAANVLPYPSCLPAFNQVLVERGLPPISHVTDILWGNLTLLATAPELESHLPPINVRGPMAFVGPVYWDPAWSDAAELLRDYGRDGETRIYVTLGHGGKATSVQVQAVLDGCMQEGWRVFVSLGFRPDGDVCLPTNAKAGSFTGLTGPMRWADVIINHGGHGTVIASLLHGKPSIVIPFMSEQESNGVVFVEDNGAGLLLRRTIESPDPKRRFSYRLRYSGPSSTGNFAPAEVTHAVCEILANPDHRANARRMSKILVAYPGARNIADHVDSVLAASAIEAGSLQL